MLQTIVKLGGSLLHVPNLAERLVAVTDRHFPQACVLVGGGDAADTVRKMSSLYEMSDDSAHRLAIRAMDFNTHLVTELSDRFRIVDSVEAANHALTAGCIPFLHPTRMLSALEAQASTDDCLAASWRVTSDSIAAWMATRLQLRRLVLLKSVASGSNDGSQGVQQICGSGLVDEVFAESSAAIASVLWCNLRADNPQPEKLR